MSRLAEWVRRRWWPSVPVVLAAAVAVVVVAFPSDSGPDDPPAPPPRSGAAPVDERTRAAVERFLDRYMDGNGRVVKRGEGGDSSSSGQAYAMLAAVAIGDRRRFDLAWNWARRNLQTKDDLLSSLWRDGEVDDPEPASDADLDAARALDLAAERFDDPAYREQAVRIATAILVNETVKVDGDLILVAGPWARAEPYPINASYYSPRAFDALGKATYNKDFAVLTKTSYRLVDALVGDPLPLPPDWAEVDDSGKPRPAMRPGTTEPVRHSLDAARLPVRFAEACDEEGRALAARLLPFFKRRAGGEPAIAYGLDGEVLETETHPMPLVAAAATAHASGEERLRDALLARAEKLERRSPTYYGSAWVALGRIMLTTDLLGRCPG